MITNPQDTNNCQHIEGNNGNNGGYNENPIPNNPINNGCAT